MRRGRRSRPGLAQGPHHRQVRPPRRSAASRRASASTQSASLLTLNHTGHDGRAMLPEHTPSPPAPAKVGESLLVPSRHGLLVPTGGSRNDTTANLTVAQVHIHIHPDEPGVLGLQLGRETLWLRPRLSALLQRLVHERRPQSAPLKDQETPYLLPGLRPSGCVGHLQERVFAASRNASRSPTSGTSARDRNTRHGSARVL